MGQDFITIRRDLHQIPELGFQEYKTQQYLLRFIEALPKERIDVKLWKTGILVKVHGRNPEKIIGYRTDIDGLPITEETGYSFRSTHEGYMHACGHDFHMSIALGILSEIVQKPIDDDVLFAFQPAEEGPGGAKPMIASEPFQAWKPDMMVALHIAPEYPVGTIATRVGLLFANTSELYIDLIGKGGHAAYPHQANDMVVAASHLVTQLQSIVSRNVDPLDPVVVTIGKITAGMVQNSIAETARLEGTMRTLSAASMTQIKKRLEAIVHGIETSFECHADIDYGANYYQVNNNKELTEEFMKFANQVDDTTIIDCSASMTGEDFGYMLQEIPGFMFWLGVQSPYGLHHAKLEPNEEAIPRAISFISQYLRFKGNR
ncbi:N-acetyldiaminopimelate deacetylase [Ectobacillus polymachus]|uniref:N-acetyldiaminopimelate deacetylase n=1 Tax=Ectobacillus polymachus TaxID=1508806 RepID=UPI003A875D78